MDLGYEGPEQVKMKAANLKFRIGNKTDMWNKVMKEVGEKRMAGPFEDIPFEHFIQSPIGLVTKDGGKKTRLIFHLSYPRGGNSVNAGIPEHKCKVRYPDFDEAVKLCIEAGKSCKMDKSDMASAFRHLPMNKVSWRYLLSKAEHPTTGKIYYFVDKCLPFGSSISCAHFQVVSDAIAHIVCILNNNKKNVNYLDDFFFTALWKIWCDQQMETFLKVCKQICFPVSLEKTFWGMTQLVFLGLLLDSERQIVKIPFEKVERAIQMIDFFLDRGRKKVTVLQVQQLCGYLNFLCRCIIPGRAFTTCLYALLAGKTGNLLKPHHHICIKEETRLDLKVWKRFINEQNVYCRPFLDVLEIPASEINMYSDASGKIGFGALCENSWMWGEWKEFLKHDPSIEYLELFALTTGVITWIHRFANRRVVLFCDNISVVHMVNSSTSKCKNCMVLIRLLVLESMARNVRVYAKYVNTKDNGLSDSLSRMDFKRFRRLGPFMDEFCTEPPFDMWPTEKIWLD